MDIVAIVCVTEMGISHMVDGTKEVKGMMTRDSMEIFEQMEKDELLEVIAKARMYSGHLVGMLVIGPAYKGRARDAQSSVIGLAMLLSPGGDNSE